MDITPVEKLILTNQYQILRLLSSMLDDAATCPIEYAKLHDIFYHGYISEMNDVLKRAKDNAVSDVICQEVLDTLDMYRAIHCSMARVDESNGLHQSRWLKFFGYDGNNESERLFFAGHLARQDLFEESLIDKKCPNSHTRMVPRYKAMLSHWREWGKKLDLTTEDLSTLANVVPE